MSGWFGFRITIGYDQPRPMTPVCQSTCTRSPGGWYVVNTSHR